jgi:hypothetical protein
MYRKKRIKFIGLNVSTVCTVSVLCHYNSRSAQTFMAKSMHAALSTSCPVSATRSHNCIILVLDIFLMARYRAIKKVSICADWVTILPICCVRSFSPINFICFYLYAPRHKRCPIFLLFLMSTTDNFRDGEHT